MSAVQSEELNCALISLADNAGRLLLPKSAVLEVVGMAALDFQPTGPNWLLGYVEWNEHQIPALSFEALCGQSMPARSRRSRLIVINSVGVHMENGLYAVLSQGHPHLAMLGEYALEHETDKHESVELCKVRIGNTHAVIPDLEAIELHYVDAMENATA